MATKPKEEQDTSTNGFLTSTLEMLPAWADELCPSWPLALEKVWPKFTESVKKDIARAQVGVESGPTPEIRKRMQAHVKALEKYLGTKPQAPEEWHVTMGYLVGEVIMKKKTEPRFGLKEAQSVLGQIDLTVFCEVPKLEYLNKPSEVVVPNKYLPEDLKTPYFGMLNREERELEKEVWDTRPLKDEISVSLARGTVTFRFVLAPAPSNYQKALKNLKMMGPWLELGGHRLGPNDMFGVITDDPALFDIVRAQGDIAVFNERDA